MWVEEINLALRERTTYIQVLQKSDSALRKISSILSDGQRQIVKMASNQQHGSLRKLVAGYQAERLVGCIAKAAGADTVANDKLLMIKISLPEDIGEVIVRDTSEEAVADIHALGELARMKQERLKLDSL